MLLKLWTHEFAFLVSRIIKQAFIEDFKRNNFDNNISQDATYLQFNFAFLKLRTIYCI